MALEFKGFLKTAFKEVCGYYLKELESFSEEELGKSPGGKARTAFDFTWEVVVVNQRIAMVLRGEKPGPWPYTDGFALAPEEVKSKEAIMAKLKESVEEVEAVVDGLSEEELTRQFTPPGRDTETSLAETAIHVVDHMDYHMGQLAYIQLLFGNDEQ